MEKKPQQVDKNLTAIVGVTLLSFAEKYLEKKTITFYTLEVVSNITKKTWKLEKRYSEFKKIHDQLEKLFPRLPTIPGTTFFKVTSEEALTKRKNDLQIFLRECVQRRDILQNKDFQKFLELDKNAPEIVGNDVKLVFDHHKLPLGVRNFILVPKKEIMLVCCSDMNLISRSNVMITNLALGSNKEDSKKVPMGAAFIYQCKPDKKEIWKIHKIWAKPYPIQTGAIDWEDKNEIFSVGNDDGKIHIYRAKPNTHYQVMDQIGELNFHTDRVMGLGIDPLTMHLFSCSTDKSFYVTDLTQASVNNILININTCGYTNLEIDAENRRLFLTNETGELAVYSLKTFPPTLVRRLQTTSLSSIRAFHIDYKNKYIFTGNVGGKICIMNLSLPDKERLISEISSFGVGDMKIRVCRSDPNRYELLTGDESGRVTIWNLKSGKPIYLWEAHPGSPITQMRYDADNHILFTGGKDVHIKIWKLPDKWISDEVDSFEHEEVNNLTAKIAEENIEKMMDKKDAAGIIDSDDDDLNGWNYRKY